MIHKDPRIHNYYNYNADKDVDKRYIGFTTALAIGGSLVTAAGGLTAAGIAVGVGVTGLAAFGAYKMMSSMSKTPETPSTSNSQALKNSEPSYDRAAALAKAETDDKRRGIARNKPNYTGPLGLTPVDKSNTNQKVLLGT